MRNYTSITTVLLSFFLLVSCTNSVSREVYDDLALEKNILEDELSEVKQERDELLEQIEELQENIEECQSDLEDCETREIFNW